MFNKKMSEKKVIRDSIHMNIVIEYQIIWDLINTNIFQRLRRIHQLGGTYMVFPGAEHSRFTHSLGVYNIVRRMINEIDDLSAHLSEREKVIVLCSALLHDIGHGPFSHAFEEVFETNHEKIGIRMIVEDTQINQVLKSYDEMFPLEISQVIDKKHPNQLLTQLISSQVDADRMDYLLRDSYNCGVSYGNFDLERLFRSIVIVDEKVAFKESGVHALEDYIFARYHMYWQVYLHPSANAFEIILNKTLNRVKALASKNYQFKTDLGLLKPFFDIDNLSIDDYIVLDEAILTYYFTMLQQEDDEILANLCNSFINRKLFKNIDLKSKDEGQKIIEDVEKNNEKQEYYFEIQFIKSSLYKYYGDLNPQSIIVVSKDGTSKELFDASELVSAIVNSAKQKVETKLYYHQDYIPELYGKY